MTIRCKSTHLFVSPISILCATIPAVRKLSS